MSYLEEDLNKTLKTILIVLVVIFVGTASFAGGFVTGHFVPLLQMRNIPLPAPALSTPSGDQQSATPQDLQTLFTPFWETWTIIHTQYVDQPVDNQKLLQGAIKGMVDSLGDKHSTYMDPKAVADFNAQLTSKQYEGIGAFVDTTNDYLTVISPIPDSPAEKAGVKPGDKIIAIDGVSMTGVPAETARQKVLGPAGSVVKLTILRASEANPIVISITRDKITVKSASGKMLDNGIAYVQIATFGDTTTDELKATLTDLMAQNPKGLILDLRFNGGGYLDTAVEVVSQFMDKGVVLYEQSGDGTRKIYNVKPGGLATKIPMVVLINEGSASASEITAGALQDYGRATLVGVVSYGKGSVQVSVPLSNNQGAIHITIAKWLTPKERTIQGLGLTPDVYVPITEADYKAGRDPQLDAAIATLMALINKTPIPTSVPTPLMTPTP